MDRLQSMEAFVKVVDYSSFTKAAQAMGLSPAMVSNHVADLENRLKVRLLERTTRSLKLTDDGTAFYAHCQRVLTDIDDTYAMLGQGRNAPRGRLRVDLSVGLANRVVLPVLPEFFARFPEIRVELHHTENLLGTRFGTFDAFFRMNKPEDPNLIGKPLRAAAMVVAAAPAYLQRYGTPASPQDLRHHSCIGYIDPITDRAMDWEFEREDSREVIRPVGVVAANQMASLIEAARAGLGIFYGMSSLITQELVEGRLVPILQDWQTPYVNLWIAYARGRYRSEKVSAFVNYIQECYPAA